MCFFQLKKKEEEIGKFITIAQGLLILLDSEVKKKKNCRFIVGLASFIYLLIY